MKISDFVDSPVEYVFKYHFRRGVEQSGSSSGS